MGRTLDVFNQNLSSAGAGVRLANVIDSDDPEVMAFELAEIWYGELGGGAQTVCVIHTHPV